MLLETLGQPFKKARSTSATDNGFPSRVPTVTAPSGTGGNVAQATASAVVDMASSGPKAQNSVLVCPYGTGSNNNTMSVRIIGWRSLGRNAPDTSLWIPVLLAELACTLSSACLGVAGATIVATEFFADTLTLTYGVANVGVEVGTNAADLIAYALVDLKGSQKVEFTFTTGGSATDCNCLYAMM